MNAIHHPVLFVHGNSDSALYFSKDSTGWTNSVRYFRVPLFNNYKVEKFKLLSLVEKFKLS